ncbi:hypothetical protein [Gimesia sp.]|uniref:hypothetical protein n=1 Tax=Gimesia sp. TaxID=2024833 RepID=UPI003A8D7D18
MEEIKGESMREIRSENREDRFKSSNIVRGREAWYFDMSSEKKVFLGTRSLQMRKKDVLQELGMGETKLDEFVRRNELRSYHIDGMLMFFNADVYDFVMQFRNPQDNTNNGLAI